MWKMLFEQRTRWLGEKPPSTGRAREAPSQDSPKKVIDSLIYLCYRRSRVEVLGSVHAFLVGSRDPQGETCAGWPYIATSGGMHKSGRAKPESPVESVTSIFAVPPTIPEKQVDRMRQTGWAGPANKNQSAKPESHVESVTSIFAPLPTMPGLVRTAGLIKTNDQSRNLTWNQRHPFSRRLPPSLGNR